VIQKLHSAGFEAYAVGGCVRDYLLGRSPQDWDVATSAKPEEIARVFPDSFYENEFGTVGVKTGLEDPALSVVEVTTFRAEEKYTDKRHPDTVKFVSSLKEDLARRDFTINAMALLPGVKEQCELIDVFGGKEDLKRKLIRAVGEPRTRFSEDALRLLRAVRFAAELGFTLEPKTNAAVSKNAEWLQVISKERIRDELVKLIMSPNPKIGFELLYELGLLRFIIPELETGVGVAQNKHHIYTVWEHNLRALQYAAEKKYELHVRIAALFHDIAKPETKEGEGPDATFYGHEVVGARVAAKALQRLRFSRSMIERTVHLVRYHLFYYNVGEVTETGVRRFLRRVGPEHVDDLVKVREADRIGSGVPKAKPYKIRHLLYMIEKVSRDPISPKMLKVNGNDVMQLLKIEPGPKVGHILHILLSEVLEDPKKNDRVYLKREIKTLGALSEGTLAKRATQSRETKEEFETGIEKETKAKYYV